MASKICAPLSESALSAEVELQQFCLSGTADVWCRTCLQIAEQVGPGGKWMQTLRVLPALHFRNFSCAISIFSPYHDQCKSGVFQDPVKLDWFSMSALLLAHFVLVQ